jgi:hypothetical protein
MAEHKVRTGQLVRIADHAPFTIPRGRYGAAASVGRGGTTSIGSSNVSDRHQRVVPERDLSCARLCDGG